ncbi:MAG: putative lipid II flippase FtsW [Candidatus Moraniibacteriota bacterium]
MKTKTLKKSDPILLAIILTLLIFGLVMLSSAGVVTSDTRYGDPYHLFKRQFFLGVIPGLILFFIAQKINYRFWRKVSVPLFFLSIVLLVLALIPGIGADFKGASRWIDLGIFSFQPAELVKLAVIVYLAAWLESHKEKIKSFKDGFLPFLAILGVPLILIACQPDFGTLGIIAIIGSVMFFISGASVKYMAGLFFGGIAFLVIFSMRGYRGERLKAFFDAGIDPQDIGYQINQALLAVGSGGLFGLGLGHSRQKFNYLPEPVGDSIYAIIAEELGFVGAIFLLSLFIFFTLRGLRIARFAPDRFSQMLAIGIVSWIVFQAFVNIMAIIKLIPLTGITLPFVSYGSTSLVFILLAVGILLNISKHSKLPKK